MMFLFSDSFIFLPLLLSSILSFADEISSSSSSCKSSCESLVRSQVVPSDDMFTKQILRRSIFLGWEDELSTVWKLLSSSISSSSSSSSTMIRVLIIGGSMTCGFDLPGKQGTWAQKVAFAIQSTRVKVDIRCGSGWGSEYFSKDPKFWSYLQSKPDILIVEFGINDQQVGFPDHPSQIYPEFFHKFFIRIKQAHPTIQIIALVASRLTSEIHSKKETLPYLEERCGNATQEVALTIFSDSSGRQFGYCHNWWHVATIQQTVFRELGIPYFSYRDAIWPFLHTPTDSLPTRWNGDSHPNLYSHDLMAVGMLRLIPMICETTCSHPEFDHISMFDKVPSLESPEYHLESLSMTSNSSLPSNNQCDHPIETLSEPNFNAISSDPTWRYTITPNSHHRYAWHIGEHNQENNVLTFRIHQGEKNLVMFEYLQSHLFEGSLDVYVTETEQNLQSTEELNLLLKLQTNWKSHVSIPNWASLHYSNGKKRLKIRTRERRLEEKDLSSLPYLYIKLVYHPPVSKDRSLFVLYSITSC